MWKKYNYLYILYLKLPMSFLEQCLKNDYTEWFFNQLNKTHLIAIKTNSNSYYWLVLYQGNLLSELHFSSPIFAVLNLYAPDILQVDLRLEKI